MNEHEMEQWRQMIYNAKVLISFGMVIYNCFFPPCNRLTLTNVQCVLLAHTLNQWGGGKKGGGK